MFRTAFVENPSLDDIFATHAQSREIAAQMTNN